MTANGTRTPLIPKTAATHDRRSQPSDIGEGTRDDANDGYTVVRRKQSIMRSGKCKSSTISSIPSHEKLCFWLVFIRTRQLKTCVSCWLQLLKLPVLYCITESWLRHDISSVEYFPPQYLGYRGDLDYKPCNQIHGGGVLIAIRNDLEKFQRPEMKTCKELL